MTVVACRKTQTGFEIAADSISVRWYTQTREKNQTKSSKLFEENGIVVGSTGNAEECNLFRIFCKTHKPASATEESILEFLSEFSDWKLNKTDKPDIENAYIIGFQKKLFTIAGYFIDEVLTYEAIGAGMDFALAALYLGHDVKKAVETAIELSVYCENPIQVIEK